MLTGGVSSLSSMGTVYEPVVSVRRPPSAPTDSAAVAPQANAASSANSPAAVSSRPAVSTPSAVEVDMASGYSMTVRGKQYLASVEESEGQFSAAVPSLQGAIVSGANEQAAEKNLDARIDELV